MFKILVKTKFRGRVVNFAQTVREHVGSMREDAWQCAPCHDCHELPRIIHEQLTSSSRVVHDMFTSSSRTVHEQFTTTARQWRSRRCVGIYRASWTLLAIPEIASEETTYITETTCPYNKADKMVRLATTKSRPKVVQVSALHYWTLLAIPEIASKETTCIMVTTCCLKQSRQNGTTCHDKIVAKSRASVSLALA